MTKTIWTLDILLYFYDNQGKDFTSLQVSDEFKIVVNEACKRLYKLKNWRYIKCVNKKKPFEYRISSKGISYMEQLKKKGINKMKPEDLQGDWNKFSSIEFLKDKGLNVPRCILINDIDSLTEKISNYRKVSIRTFKDEDVLCPHMPNREYSPELINECISLIGQGYNLILAEPIDPKNAVVKGNVRMDSNGWVMEYIKGAGTVRDIEKTSTADKNYGFITNDIQSATKRIGPGAASIIRDIEKLFWGRSIIVEWSIYSKNIGVHNNRIIFWEIRPGEYRKESIVSQFHGK